MFGARSAFSCLGRLDFWEGFMLTSCYFARKGLAIRAVLIPGFGLFVPVLRFPGRVPSGIASLPNISYQQWDQR